VAQRPAAMVTWPSEAVNRPSRIIQTQQRIPQSQPQVRASRLNPINVNAPHSIPSSRVAPSPSTSTAQSLADGQATFRFAQELRSPSVPLPTPDQGQAFGSYHQPASRNIALHANETIQQSAEVQQAPREQLRSPSPASSLSPTVAFDQPPLPASVLLPRQNQSNPNPHPHKRQRIQVPEPSLKGRVALINAHVASVGGTQHLNNELERPRFQLLSEACNAEDTFYVALHQLFCLWDSPKRGLILSLPNFPTASILEVAFKVLAHLIRDNKALAPNHLKWFIDFPSPLADLMRLSDAYQKIVINVGHFLGKLASDWAPLSRVCASRGYPPMVDELINRMELTSPILQHIMFTATRRNLGVEDDRYGEQMEKVFGEDKQGHQEFAARLNTGEPPTEKEIVERNQVLIDKYLSINNHRIRSRRMSGPVMGSPLASSPLVAPQGNVQSSALNSSNDASIASRPQNVVPNGNQNFPSPDLWHQTQQMQPIRMVSNPSPNPLVQAVAGRPPSGIGYPSYSNAPSPTLLQGLSMNSPVVQSPILQQQGFQWSAATPVLRGSNYQDQNVVACQANGMVPITPQQRQQQIMMQQQHQQLAAQQQLQLSMQQIAAQQQQHLSMQTQQWQHQTYPQMPQQTQTQVQQQSGQMHHQVQQSQQRPFQQPPQNMPAPPHQVQQAQQRQLEQQRQHMATATQQVLSMNRAAHLRNSDAVEVQQRTHSRNNSASSGGRPPASSNSPNLALPRSIPSFMSSPATQNKALLAYTNAQPLKRNLVPPLGFQQPAQPTNPNMTALHQAHIRSPRLVPEDLSSKVPEDDPSRRFYQFVKDLAMHPIKIPVSSAMSYLEFSISDHSYSLISMDKVIGTDRLPVREFKRGSLQYRLRCIQTKRDSSKCLIPDWIISDTVWPETVFVEINSRQLEVRRKNHHGKDLPIDITQFVVPKSSPGNINRIKVSIPRLRRAMKDNNYFIAVEIIEVLQHPQIMKMCTQYQRIPASKTLDTIKKSLARPQTEDDDDFAMVVSDLSIDLADPFTARIFEIPVRGSSCLHRECFDLETFLLTRNSKSKRPNQPSMIDVWKCPLCGKDARPYSLQVDDFLASVRGELAVQDKLDTKAILISADGSWRPKPEPRPMKRKATGDLDDDDPDSSDGEGTARRQQAVGRKNNPHLNGSRASKEVEVIELDDD
jgi:hypothetical protein